MAKKIYKKKKKHDPKVQAALEFLQKYYTGDFLELHKASAVAGDLELDLGPNSILINFKGAQSTIEITDPAPSTYISPEDIKPVATTQLDELYYNQNVETKPEINVETNPSGDEDYKSHEGAAPNTTGFQNGKMSIAQLLEMSKISGVSFKLIDASNLGDIVSGSSGGSKYVYVARTLIAGCVEKVAIRVKNNNDISVRMEPGTILSSGGEKICAMLGMVSVGGGHHRSAHTGVLSSEDRDRWILFAKAVFSIAGWEWLDFDPSEITKVCH